MKFLVYEQDSLVRADIFETVQSAYRAIVRMIPTLEQTAAMVASQKCAPVLVMSVSSEERDDAIPTILSQLPDSPIVLIGTSPPEGFEPTRKRAFLARPFSSEGLLSAVTGVLSDRP